ncbi:MAG: ankyrin repeat domain-containing protein [Aliarcobacter sp.]|nr:ankyrin repeat domain-containing protein [Aliarcobacter sp.]
MDKLTLEQLVEEQSILSIQEIIKQKIDMSEIKLTQYLNILYSNKKDINIEFLKLLLQTNIDKSSPTKKGFTPELLATLFGNVEVTKIFIDNGFDMNKKVEFIIHNFNPKINSNSAISQTIKDEDKKYISPFGMAFENYNNENIKLLLENGADINETIYELKNIISQRDFINSNALNQAIANNDTKIVEFLLKNKFNKKALDFIPFHSIKIPCEEGNLPLLKLLIEYGLNINLKYGFSNTTLLEICSEKTSYYGEEKRFFNICEYLIQKGADVNIGSPLLELLIAEAGDDEIAELLIKNGANVNYIDSNGRSPLIEACRKFYGDRYKLVKLLIEYGANLNYQDKNGNTALMMIHNSGQDFITIDKNDANEVLSTEKIMNFLLENGADINIRNKMGMTPLMQHAINGNDRLVKILLERGADINAKSEMTAFDLAKNEEIKNLIKSTKNNNPQKLVKILSNFTIDKPIKYTTHQWDFGELKKEYGDFDGYMNAVKNQFDKMKTELEELSPNLYKKIYTFLIEENPDENYSWCSKTSINVGWSSLEGLKEHCNSGNNPFDFKLPKTIAYEVDFETITINTFEGVINLFKQEIEIRDNFKNLENLFANKVDTLGENFHLDLSTAKLGRQFYTDTQKFSNVLDKIFYDMSTREKFPNIKVNTTELEDRSIELKITQIDSSSSRSADELLERANIAGDISEIKQSLMNLCDWSIESSFEDENFRVNFLHSNNVKDIEILETKPLGFTHILRFYK